VVAVRLAELREALGRLDGSSRAALEAAFPRGLPEEDAAAAFERLVGELGLDGREARDELFATLHDVPGEYWHS
jgi:DNA-directed RNA polymerase specialized sigma24 family protein